MEDEFCSGPWTGFYTYANRARERMDLSLSFREGVVTGAGSDPVGNFSIKGAYDPASNEVHWIKTYPGRHSVYYKGCRDNRGIWGTWEIAPGVSGGFHIWPKGEGQGESQEVEAEVDAPAAEDAIRMLEKKGTRPMKRGSSPDSP